YGYCKNLKKMVETGQSRIRERNREYKSQENAIKEAQRPMTHGCHVGNPCAPQSNPMMEREHPMIEGMKGQDLWEHLPTSKA
ncbi:hypothetical protein Tco_0963351, partial [Tanacetum coccineum]